MKNLQRTTIISVAAITFTLAGAIYAQQNSIAFFSRSLQENHISENVVVHGIQYSVVDGLIAPIENSRSALKTLKILETAFEKARVRNAAYFDLSGTDPKNLLGAASLLRKNTDLLAHLQTATASRMLIENLYPTSYLEALANLELARQSFLTSGSDKDADTYSQKLDLVIQAGEKDVTGFRNSFEKAMSTSSLKKFATEGGIVSTSKMNAAIIDIQDGLGRIADSALREKWCARGSVWLCDSSRLQTSTKDSHTDSTNTSHAKIENTARNNRSILAAASAQSPAPTAALVEISESACVDQIPGPYIYLPSSLDEIGSMHPPRILNELFFYSTSEENAKNLEYLKNSLGISYALYNPSSFYNCPRSGEDISRIHSVLATAEFARAHEQIAKKVRTTFLSSPDLLRESSARDYIHAALADSSLTDEEKKELLGLSRSFQFYSAGLETLVEQINSITAHDIALVRSGIPFDVSPQNLFLLHSAFLSLFQSYNPSFGSYGITIFDEDSKQRDIFKAKIVPYSALKKIVPYQILFHDLKAYFAFERSD